MASRCRNYTAGLLLPIARSGIWNRLAVDLVKPVTMTNQLLHLGNFFRTDEEHCLCEEVVTHAPLPLAAGSPHNERRGGKRDRRLLSLGDLRPVERSQKEDFSHVKQAVSGYQQSYLISLAKLKCCASVNNTTNKWSTASGTPVTSSQFIAPYKVHTNASTRHSVCPWYSLRAEDVQTRIISQANFVAVSVTP